MRSIGWFVLICVWSLSALVSFYGMAEVAIFTFLGETEPSFFKYLNYVARLFSTSSSESLRSTIEGTAGGLLGLAIGVSAASKTSERRKVWIFVLSLSFAVLSGACHFAFDGNWPLYGGSESAIGAKFILGKIAGANIMIAGGVAGQKWG